MKRVFLAIFALCLCASAARLAAQITWSGNVSISGNTGLNAFITYLYDTFETGDTSKWTGATGDVAVNSVQVKNGTYSLEIHYPSGSDDINRYVYHTFNPEGTHFFVGGWVYFATPVTGQCGQRKIYYFKTTDSGAACGGAGFSTYYVLTSDQANSIGDTPQGTHQRLRASIGNCLDGEVSFPRDTDNTDLLSKDTYYWVAMEVQLNTLGQSDGWHKVWLNGNLLADVSESGYAARRATMNDNFNTLEVGRQFDPYDCATLAPLTTSEEYRYWDDVRIASSYIGP